MAANMDGVGELGVAESLSEFGMITSLTKQHDVKKINQYKRFIGALVYIKSQRRYGYVLSAIDNEQNFDICRFKVWTVREKFGTFLDDCVMIQFLSGSY